MRTINLYDAKTHLSQLVDRAAGGEEIIIGKNGKPLVKMVAYKEISNTPRVPGSWKGRVTIHADFDELPPEVAEAFAGEAP
jgi:prevent-host-death family protein